MSCISERKEMLDHGAPFFFAVGGQVQAVLTSDSPALVGSNITFVVSLVFPRCQKEDANGNIVYEKNCRDGKECCSHHRNTLVLRTTGNPSQKP
jgi:hypothetical protein